MKGVKRWVWPALVALVLFVAPRALAGEPGRDVVETFARAHRGEPLRYVAIGGSITQASGPGWVGDWLREVFPLSAVTVVNSGMSGTGSSLGIFRVERDVLAHQPDLVAIEFCVNDGGVADESTIRYMETLVVRLKSAPRPPAIIILEAAARTGVNLQRHRRVARHYGLLEVDFQEAVDARLAAEGKAWSVYFSDDVHPNRAGHALYAETMRRVLSPLVEEARRRAPGDASPREMLPAPLSVKPLLLDARLVPLQGWMDKAGDWRPVPAPTEWWGRFFQGGIAAERPGAALRIPFRGTTAGVLFALRENYGTFFLNVDGRTPMHVVANGRNGFSSVLAEADLPPGEHTLNVVLPAADASGGGAGAKIGGPVMLGYLLVAGENQAGSERAAEGPFGVETLRELRFETVPTAAWSWTGPFPVPAAPDGRAPADAISAIGLPFLPRLENAPDADEAVEWRAVSAGDGEEGLVDFRALTGSQEPGVAYARALWRSETEGVALLSVAADYYAWLWLNGERILTLEGPHRVPVFLPVRLRAGENRFVLKIGAGSAGFSARLKLAPVGPVDPPPAATPGPATP